MHPAGRPGPNLSVSISDPRRFALGLVLTLVAGWVAAVGFLELGGVYTSFMSGNTVQFGLLLALGHWDVMSRAGVAVVAFLLGAILGSVVVAKGRAWGSALALSTEAVAIGFGAWLLAWHAAWSLAIIASLSFGMGIQNHIVAKTRIDNAGTTFVTGVSFRLGDAIAKRLVDRDRSGLWIAYLAVWTAFGLGAGLGTYCETQWRRLAMTPPAAALAVLACGMLIAEGVAAWRRRRHHRK